MKKTYILVFLVAFTAISAFAQVVGTWKIAPQAAALGVGPSLGDISWWSNSAAEVTLRACLFDDEYVFNEDGSFQNVQQEATWVEPWQGVTEGCATPVAPHDGSIPATWVYDAVAGTVTLNGMGAYLGLSKVYNGGECTSPEDAPASITYPVEFNATNDTMTINIEIADGAYWRFILTTNAGDPPPPEETLTLPVTFDDEGINYGLTDFGGNSSEIVVDPTDETNHVVKTIKTTAAETWAGTTVGGTVGFEQPVPFTEGSTSMTVKVWSPTAGTPIRLKVEASNDDEITCETEALTTVAMEWETLVFDFSNEAPGTAELNLANSYNKASMFFNFGTTGADAGEQTYYWDDMDFDGDIPEEKPYLAMDVQENFEDDGWSTITSWKFQDASELSDLLVVPDPTNASNHIAAYVRSGTFEWTNAQFILDHRMDLTVRNKFDLTVALPSTNDYSGDLTPTVAMKLQNSLLGGEAWTTQTEVKLTVDEFDKWIKLTFDFSEVADRTDYDQIVIQFGGEGHFVAGQFSFDDLWLIDDSGILESNLTETNIYPNPVIDVLYLENAENLDNISIYTVRGQLIYQSDEVSTSVNVNDFPAGLYTLRANGKDGKQYFAKFIIK